ncbi:Nascent polypeptide-associated complex protein [Candidatus Gugararchaeum adminiculabundum]|nr:Nascent polypeptide-associated complex protein [Candidatus Gugararchaeum adminiculabundum]
MIPGMGGMDPRQMARMMKQMGINSREIKAKRVVIEGEDGTNLIVSQPSVTEIDMQGQKSFQVAGNISEETAISKEDIELVCEQTGCGKADAENAIKDANGDIAEAILKLKKE